MMDPGSSSPSSSATRRERSRCFKMLMTGVAFFSENTLALPQLWLFIVAPLVGACLAGLAYKCLAGCCKNCKKD